VREERFLFIWAHYKELASVAGLFSPVTKTNFLSWTPDYRNIQFLKYDWKRLRWLAVPKIIVVFICSTPSSERFGLGNQSDHDSHNCLLLDVTVSDSVCRWSGGDVIFV
jgi:hypothetical protein